MEEGMVAGCLVLMMMMMSAGTAMGGVNLFILAGQSNMVGQGGITVRINYTGFWNEEVPPQCRSDRRILRLNEELLWEEAREPLYLGISFSECNIKADPNSGVGPGMPFAHSLLTARVGVIGLVPCAVSGTSISQWHRGSCLYNRMLRRVRAAQLQGGVLRGLLWYQGESDTGSLEQASLYGGRLEAFFTDLRRDLLCPRLPIIQVALASVGVKEPREIVRQVQLHTSLPNVKCVDAAGLPLNGVDNLHLTTDSQVRLGSMLVDAFLRYFDLSEVLVLQAADDEANYFSFKY